MVHLTHPSSSGNNSPEDLKQPRPEDQSKAIGMSLYTGLLEGTFSRSGDAIFFIDRAGFIDCNDAALRLFGFTDKTEFLKHHPGEFAPERQPDGRLSVDVADADMAAAFANGHALIEWQHQRKDGTRFFSEVMLVGFMLDGREALTATIRDITKRKEAELALKSSEMNLQLILDALPGLVAWIGDDGRHRYVNRQYEEFMGRPAAELLGAPLVEALGVAGAEVRELGNAARAGEVVRWSGWFASPGKGERHVDQTYAPRRQADGQIDGYYIFSLDITDQKRAEDEVVRQRDALHQSEKMGALGSLLAGVAHEMNNPLSVVLAQTVLMMETATDPKMAARGSKIHTAAERCARIVKSFLAIARQRPPVYAPVAARAVVSSALEITHYGLGANGIAVDIDIEDTLPPVWGDGDQLSQVMMNLIVNAQQSLQEQEGPRRLRISAEAEGVETIAIRIADSGKGIAPEIRSRIFDPFFTTKPVGKGTGVGLAVCIGIVQAHMGVILLEETPGGGATFVVRLPIAPAAESSTDHAPAEPAAVAGKSVLIVDDEPEIAQILAEIIGPLVHRLDIASNGISALRLLEERRYDLIVSDLRMPDLDGPGLLRQVRAEPKRHEGPILFVTGDTLYHNLEQFLSDSGVPILEKPFQPREVRLRVSELLAGE